MSLLVLATGHEIPVEPDPKTSQENLVALIDSGEEWAFSTVTGAWFKLAHVVAILPSRVEAEVAPEPKPAKKRTSSARKKAQS